MRSLRTEDQSGRLIAQINPDRDMIGGLFPGPDVLVDAGGRKPVCGFGRKQNVIDANAIVLPPGAGLKIPE